MTRAIEKYSKLHSSIREQVYRDYKCGEIERNTFPYKGSIVDGIIYQYEDVIYLTPIATIVSGRYGSLYDIDDEAEDSSLEMDSNL